MMTFWAWDNLTAGDSALVKAIISRAVHDLRFRARPETRGPRAGLAEIRQSARFRRLVTNAVHFARPEDAAL